MRFWKAVSAVGASGALVMGLASPADAAKDVVYDVRGDAKPRMDIMKVKFKHGKKRVVAKIFVRNLRKRGEFMFAAANRKSTIRYGMHVQGNGTRRPKVQFYKDTGGPLRKAKCRGDRAMWRKKADTVRMTFPKRCYRKLGKRFVLATGSAKNFPTGRTVDDGPVTILKRG